MFEKSLSKKLLFLIIALVFFLCSVFICIFSIMANSNSQSSSSGGAISYQAPFKTVSEGENVDLSILNFTINNLSYQWYKNATESNIGGTAVSSAQNGLPKGNHYFYVELTINQVKLKSNVVTVNITEDDTEEDEPQVDLNLLDFEIENTKVDNLTYKLSYQWYGNSVDSNGTSAIKALSGATSAKYTTPLVNGIYYFYVELTLTITDSSTNPQLTSYINLISNAIDVKVNRGLFEKANEIVVEKVKAAESVDLSFYFEEAVYPWACKYQWYTNSTKNNTEGTAISGATDATYKTPTTLTPGTYYYYVVLTIDGGMEITSDVITVTIVADAKDPVINNQPKSETIYKGDNKLLSVNATSPDGGVLTYKWYMRRDDVEAFTLIEGATQSTYEIEGLLDQTGRKYYFYVEITNSKDNGNGLRVTTINSDEIEIIQSGLTINGTVAILLGVFAFVAIGGFVAFKLIKRKKNSKK